MVNVRTNRMVGAGQPAPSFLRSRLCHRIGNGPVASLLKVLCVLALVLTVAPVVAHADDVVATPSVLVVDSNLGDGEQLTYLWLGKDAEPLAESGDIALYTCADAAWWGAGGGTGAAPETFVLQGSGASPLTAEHVTWALDTLGEAAAEPRTFVVAMGTAGLAVRSYVEDLAAQKQANRADIVGLAFCGTPHNGYSASLTYPESRLWGQLAQSVGLAVTDLDPASGYLAELNAGTFPNVCKTLSLAGAVGDLGFGRTDGAAVTSELVPAVTLSDQMEIDEVDATIGRAINLTGSWQPFTSSIDYPQRTIDAKPTELLSAMNSYETSDEVQAKVREFYDAWFSTGAPVTHNSNVLLLDLSGSMLERIDETNDKLTAAKEAAQEYLHAMRALSGLPQSAPMDVTVVGFGEATTDIASTYDQAACDAISQMKAVGETNIGLALDRALAALDKAPTCATKHILLLSDGASTQGQSNKQMFAGAIARAKKRGIVIDTIGFGNVGESNAGFLKQVAKRTGGTYYTAQDTYSLKVNFLKAYYATLGLPMVDEELGAGTTKTELLGIIDARTSALEIGVVSERETPTVSLTCNGEPVDASLYTVSVDSGLTSLSYLSPQAGEYELQLAGTSGATHVFAVRQQGINKAKQASAEEKDISLYLMIGAGVALVAAITATVLVTRRRSRVNVSESTGTVGSWSNDTPFGKDGDVR